jgi:predicted amidohydrolase YtcJ
LQPGASGDAIWWQNGAVRAVGPAKVLEPQVPSRTQRYDLPEALVTPGFTDGHTHFAMYAQGRTRVHLAGAGTRAEALRRIAEGVPEQGWVRGHGWDANRWAEAPDRIALDAVTSVPAFFESRDVHAAWTNSAGLAAAGIDRSTPDPAGGRIVRDASGDPTGLLLERAQELVQAVLPAPDPGRLLEAMRQAQGEAHRMGVTGIHDVEGPEALRAFRTMELEDRLRLRVLFQPPVHLLPSLLRQGVQSGMGSAWLSLGGVKLFLDGSLGSRTAWMLEAYEDGLDAGLPLATEGDARQAVTMAAAAGLSATVHAIGDAAVRCALNLLESLPTLPVPHRIEHFQCVHPADLGRAGAAGIVVSMQPAHLPGDVALAESRWGGRSCGAFATRSLLKHGAVLAFGSDVPVASIDPRPGVLAATTRVAADGSFPGGWHAQERLTLLETIRAFTLGNGIAAGLGGRRGRLGPGYDADLVAWETEAAPLEGDGRAFAAGRAVLTVVGGEVVYRV